MPATFTPPAATPLAGGPSGRTRRPRSGGARRAARPGRRPRLRTVALTAAATFAVTGFLSGRLIDEYGGVGGAVEWVLRTAVVISALVAVGAGFGLVARVRRVARRRVVGWGLAALATAGFAMFVAQPVLYAVYLTHLPARRAVEDVAIGAPKQPVAITARDGLELRGWYVPSRNGAAVMTLHGTGSNRVGLAGQAKVLARHGYGVLMLDLPGHGESEGRSTSATWKGNPAVAAAVDYLRARPDVDPARIGAVGVSMGAQIALTAAASDARIAALVAEGAAVRTPAEALDAGAGAIELPIIAGMFGVAQLLEGSSPAPLGDQVEAIGNRPLLLISAGRGQEARANENHRERGGSRTELWNLPDASHGGALRAGSAAYERTVIGFLDRALPRAAR